MRLNDPTYEPEKYQTHDWVIMAWIGGIASLLWFL